MGFDSMIDASRRCPQILRSSGYASTRFRHAFGSRIGGRLGRADRQLKKVSIPDAVTG